MGYDSFSEAEKLARRGFPARYSIGLWLMLASISAFCFWACVSSIDEVVVAPGIIGRPTRRITLQPDAISTIIGLYVRPGDVVKKGDLLASFDSIRSEAEQRDLETRKRSGQAEADRLEAEVNGSIYVESNTDEARLQRRLYESRRESFRTGSEVRHLKIESLEAQILSNQQQELSVENQISLNTKIISVHDEMVRRGTASTIQLLTVQRDNVTYQARQSELLGDIAKFTKEKAEAIADLASFESDWKRDAMDRLVTVRRENASVDQELIKAIWQNANSRLIAPVSGTILEIGNYGAGSVIREGETLFSIAPNDGLLEVTADVQSQDRARLQLGGRAKIKLDAYPFQKYGTIDAEISMIGADSLVTNNKAETIPPATYQIRTSILNPEQIEAKGMKLLPGLGAIVEFYVGRRTIASYLLRPIVGTFNESLREP